MIPYGALASAPVTDVPLPLILGAENPLGQALEHVRDLIAEETLALPSEPAPLDPQTFLHHTHDTVFEVDPATHLRLGTTSTPNGAHTATLSGLLNSVPDAHAPEVLLTHSDREYAFSLPEQGPDLSDGVATMDNATFTMLPVSYTHLTLPTKA